MKVKRVHCKRKVSIEHGGESDMKESASTALRKDTAPRLVQASDNNRIDPFFVREASSEEHEVIASELALLPQ
jgi:hypothetical protein